MSTDLQTACTRMMELDRLAETLHHSYSQRDTFARTFAPRAARALTAAVTALEGLKDGTPGAFSRDRMEHAANCIQAAQVMAAEALSQIYAEFHQ